MGKSGTQVLRPLFWWVLLVLVLFGIHTHQRLIRETKLNFTVTLNGQPLDATATLDGKSFFSGQNISLGSHAFIISNLKTESFNTNFFAWYGQHDLGEIKLQRSTGTLNVSINPQAAMIAITGPEFSAVLTNCTGTNVNVPTDAYTVTATYPHWSQTQNVTVFDNQSAACVFRPQFGNLSITCNKDSATYELKSDDQTFNGYIPATFADLPAGRYHLSVTYHNYHWGRLLRIETGSTNDVVAQFVLGAAHIETVPSGAQVTDTNGNYLGQTPLDILDAPHTAQLNLSLNGYAPVSVTLELIADQTNYCSTNLVNLNYAAAMRKARADLSDGNYNGVAHAAATALNSVPDDADALTLQTKANTYLDAERQAGAEQRAQLKRPREVFDSLCRQDGDASLFVEHGLKTGQPAKVVAAALAKTLLLEPRPFEILTNDSPAPKTYEIVARQTFSLGILGGTERVALIVVGQTKEGETQILFKVLEYQIKNVVVANSLFNIKDDKRLIPISQANMQMTDALQEQIRDGVQIVGTRITKASGRE